MLVPADVAPWVGAPGAASSLVHRRAGSRSGAGLAGWGVVQVPSVGPVSHGVGRFPGQPAVGSGGDAARGPVLGCEELGVSWGLGWPLVAGSSRQGVPQALRRHRAASPPWCGAECFPSRWKARDPPGHRRVRPVVVRLWSPSDAVVLAGSVVLPAWPHVFAGGSLGRPVMVPEPSSPELCSAASAWSG